MSTQIRWQESQYSVAVVGVGEAGEKAVHGKRDVLYSQSCVSVSHYSSVERVLWDKICSQSGWLIVVVDLGDTTALGKAVEVAQCFRKKGALDALVCITLTQYAGTPWEMYITEIFDKIFFVDSCEELYEPVKLFTAIQYDGYGLIGVCYKDLLRSLAGHRRIFLNYADTQDYAKVEQIGMSFAVSYSLLQRAKEKNEMCRRGQRTIAVFGVFPQTITLDDLENVFDVLCEGLETHREVFLYAKTHEAIAEERILLSVYTAEI